MSTKRSVKSKSKSKKLYSKNILITLTGSSDKDINAVAHSIHSNNHKLLVGGAKRKVTMTHKSTEIIKIFDGLIQ